MKKVVLGFFAACMIMPFFAKENITIKAFDETGTFSVEEDIALLFNSNKGEIEAALYANQVTKAEVGKYIDAINAAYENLDPKNPYTTSVNGLNGFSDDLKDTIPNTQIQQNVWANSWIGYLVQVGNGVFCPRFGFGVNAGVATVDTESIKKTGEAFKTDMGALPSVLPMPTITFDARVGGVKVGDFALPFDFGFTLCTIDSSKLGLDKMMDKLNFDFFSIGFDVRYCLWEPHVLDTKFSVGAGFYYTKGNIGVDSDAADIGMDFKSSNFNLNAQISTKLLFFRPFAGAKLMFTNSEVNWGVTNVDWTEILGSSSSDIIAAATKGLLPKNFEGGADGFKFRPVLQGGFAFDFAVIDLTFSASYDFSSKVIGGALSTRFSL